MGSTRNFFDSKGYIRLNNPSLLCKILDKLTTERVTKRETKKEREQKS